MQKRAATGFLIPGCRLEYPHTTPSGNTRFINPILNNLRAYSPENLNPISRICSFVVQKAYDCLEFRIFRSPEGAME
jgi:hypothetical protein